MCSCRIFPTPENVFPSSTVTLFPSNYVTSVWRSGPLQKKHVNASRRGSAVALWQMTGNIELSVFSKGQVLPPQNVSLRWKTDFEPQLSWEPPQHSADDCTYQVERSTTNKEEDKVTFNVSILSVFSRMFNFYQTQHYCLNLVCGFLCRLHQIIP